MFDVIYAFSLHNHNFASFTTYINQTTRILRKFNAKISFVDLVFDPASLKLSTTAGILTQKGIVNHHPRFERKLNRLSIRIFKITSCRVSKKKILLLWVNITSIFVYYKIVAKNRIVAKTLLQKLVSTPMVQFH